MCIRDRGKPDQSDEFQLPPLNFGSGFEFRVNRIHLANHNIAYHQDTVRNSPKFDPNHVAIDHLQVLLGNLLVSENALQVDVQNIGGNLGSFTLDQLKTKIDVGMREAKVADLALSTAGSDLNLEISARYGLWDSLPENLTNIFLEFDVSADLTHQDFAYFIPDSIFQLLDSIPDSQLELTGQYSDPLSQLDQLNLAIGQSHWLSSGTFKHLSHPDLRSWDQVQVNATIGPEFEAFLTSLIGGINWPSPTEIALSTHGNQQQFEAQTQVASSAGSASIKAKAGLKTESIVLHTSNITGHALELGSILSLPWLGPVDFTMEASGQIGENMDLDVSGTVQKILLDENLVQDLAFDGHLNSDHGDLTVEILDPEYPASLHSEVSFADGVAIKTDIELMKFHLGELAGGDSSLVVSTVLSSQISIPDATKLVVSINSSEFLLANDSLQYQMDSLALKTTISEDSISLLLQSDHLLGQFYTNFDLNQISNAASSRFRKDGQTFGEFSQSAPDKTMEFEMHLTSDEPLVMLSDQIDYLSELNLSAKFSGPSQSFEVNANTGGFKGYGFQIDTLATNIDVENNIATADITITDLFYDSLNLGDLKMEIKQIDSAALSSRVILQRDSMILLGINSRILPGPRQLSVHIDSLKTFNKSLQVNATVPIVLSPGNIQFEHFTIGPEESGLMLDGDLDELKLAANDIDLTWINNLVTYDTTIISHGNLNALFSFTKSDNNVNLQARIDSLIIADAPAVNLAATASTVNGRIPFSLILNSTTNHVEIEGNYEITPSLVNARATLDIKELSMFKFLLAENLDQISGEAVGQLDITGPPEALQFQGDLNLNDVDLITNKPKSRFYIKEEKLSFARSGLELNDFVIYDSQLNPLTLNGFLLTEDYQSFTYDLKVETDNYILIDNPRQDPYQIQGILVVGSDLEVSGNQNDTRIRANITIKDTTNISYILPQDDLELMSNEGIVEFVDPHQEDTIRISESQTFYDSLIATFPEFNLNARVLLEEKATLQVVINAKSGDFIEARGKADIKTEIDRSGNMLLEGDYTITTGFYQLSFYDLVRKRFEIAPGSSIRWTGNPMKGTLNFKATYNINSSSIGLIGHEVGEGERAVYRRSLPYEVGIIITGTIEEPQIAFDLDLPEADKINFPVLANKLDRLRQPEFESELNKQVFGLLVLGGFIPEASTSEFDQSLIATTALTNSVNSILASQLNRFAGQVVKGVDMNVAMQSYSDYATGTGSAQTRTTMDFTLTKRMMNDRLSIEVGAGVDINSDQSGAPTGSDNFRGDITVIYDLTESGNKQIKLFNNETYDIIYHEIRNTGISLIFIKDYDKDEKRSQK